MNRLMQGGVGVCLLCTLFFSISPQGKLFRDIKRVVDQPYYSYTPELQKVTLHNLLTYRAYWMLTYEALCLALSRNPNAHASDEVNTMQQKVALSVDTPSSIYVAPAQVYWEVTASNGRQTPLELWGKYHTLKLLVGRYNLRLRIGSYKWRDMFTVTTRNQQAVKLKANIGRIEASANTVVDWSVHNLSTGERIKLGKMKSVSTLVGVGHYRVDAALNDLHRAENISVSRGATVKSKLHLPAGEVKLMATRGGAPLFKPVIWSVYRLENDRRKHKVAEYKRHAQEVMMPPGYYEAELVYRDVTRSRRFWVKHGTSNRVIVAVD